MAYYTDATIQGVLALINSMTESSARLMGRKTSPCPVCRMLVHEGKLPEHARSYGDREHADFLVVHEVMES